MFIDSHCHLDFYEKEELPEILNRAEKTNVKYMLNACASKNSFDKILKIIADYKNVFGAIGIHPHEAEDMGSPISEDELLLYINKSKKIIAIGETGLDYSRENINKDIQMENLYNHIVVAQKTDLPLIIHNRDSNEDMINILTEGMKKSPFKCIIHCFTADEYMAKKMLDLDFFISASGITTFKNSIPLQEVFKNVVPLQKMLIETDSPYLAPVPYRGSQNEPSFVVEVAKKLSLLKNISTEDIGNITSNNFKTLFDLDI
ncbi:TatD family hydrolase [bacterium]|nr:TatD family hydrolase [bacterium]